MCCGSLFDVRCSLFAAFCSLFVCVFVRCSFLLFTTCRLVRRVLVVCMLPLCVNRCLLFGGFCLSLFIVRCLLMVGCWLVFVVCCLLCVVCCCLLLFVANR